MLHGMNKNPMLHTFMDAGNVISAAKIFSLDTLAIGRLNISALRQ
jgi:hypothetical protein